MTSVLDPVRLGALQLPNRAVMAPLGRARCDADRAPTPLVAEYYVQRASAGLIVTEATTVSAMSASRPQSAGNYNALQAAAWRRIAARIHEAGGRVFQQLYHLGRKADPTRMPNGATPVAPSAIACIGKINGANGPIDFAVPRALETDEIPGVVDEFRAAVANAHAAGMDGVEIHGANGYLIDEFLRDGSNVRTDGYGGSIASRARFLLEIVDAAAAIFGADRVGVRISPHFTVDGIGDSDPAALFGYVATELAARRIAYLHVIESCIPGRPNWPPAAVGPLLPALRRRFRGCLVVNGGYDRASADAVISAGAADLVSFGELFIANPDLVDRFRRGGPYNAPDRATFYGGGAAGYTDYPALAAATAHP